MLYGDQGVGLLAVSKGGMTNFKIIWIQTSLGFFQLNKPPLFQTPLKPIIINVEVFKDKMNQTLVFKSPMFKDPENETLSLEIDYQLQGDRSFMSFEIKQDHFLIRVDLALVTPED